MQNSCDEIYFFPMDKLVRTESLEAVPTWLLASQFETREGRGTLIFAPLEECQLQEARVLCLWEFCKHRENRETQE